MSPRKVVMALIAGTSLLAACGGSSPAGDAATIDAAADTGTDVGPADVASPDASADVGTQDTGPTPDAGLVGARPYNFFVPAGYDRTQPTPLVIMLHGYGASGTLENAYLGLTALARARIFLYAYPDGTLDASGSRFWNATDACCNFGHVAVDDVAYISAIIDDVSAHYNVDPHRVFVIGHSNGAFMAHRLACDITSRIAAIMSLAGDNWADMTQCHATGTISVLQVHGDADATIAYTGGMINGVAYPSAVQTATGWGTRNGCTMPLADTGRTLDIESTLPGAETQVSAVSGCPSGVAGELWTIHGGSHIPAFQPTFIGSVYDWLMAHPRP